MKKIAYAAAMTLALAACSSKKEAEQGLPLSFAPASTAYVFGNQESIPDSAYERFKQMSDVLVPGLVESAGRAIAQLDQNDASDQKTKAVLELLSAKLKSGVDSIGLNPRGHAALYEINALPVLRIELTDTEKFKQFIAELEKSAQKTLAVKTVGEQNYWSLDLGTKSDAAAPQAELILATVGKQAVITVYTPAAGTSVQALLGLEKPAQSILDSAEWKAVNKDYGYQPYGTFILKPKAVVEQFIGTAGKDTWLSKLQESKGERLSDVCRTEIASIAGKAPRIIAGYTAMDKQTFESKTVIELDGGLAKQLVPLAVAVPGVGTSTGRGLDVGMGIDLNKLAGVISTQAQAITKAPYQCELLADLNEGAQSAPSALSGLYMVAGFVNGMRVNVANFDADNMTGNATLLVASPDPTGLLGMMQGFLPNLASVNPTPGAAPQRISSEVMAAVGADSSVPLWFAASDKALGFSLGEDGAKTLSNDLAAALPKTPPVLAVNVTGEFYAKFNELSADDEDATVTEILQPLEKAMGNFYKQIDNDASSFIFTEKGLEIHQKTSFKK